MRKRLLIGLLVIILLLVVFDGTPLVQSFWRFVGAIVNVIGAVFGLFGRAIGLG